MAATQPAKYGKRSPLLAVLLGLFVLGVVFAVGGFAFAASQETNDSFCASCHTQPESTFVQRSTILPPTDLASFHTPQSTRCIDCHSGPGLTGRVQAELLGARNAATWYSGTSVQPAKLIFPIQDGNCLKCHQAVTQAGFVPKETATTPGVGGGRGEEGRNNHWHQLLSRWQAASSSAGTCTSCHPGHSTGATAQSGFQAAQATTNVCDACHRVLRTEGGGG